jgi:broad specificity phosphatase PhoE
MTVTLLRHFKVLNQRPRRLTPDGYRADVKAYDEADVAPQEADPPPGFRRIITSGLRRTHLTCALLFGDRPFQSTHLLDEVSTAPFTDRDRPYDALFLDVMARLQWRLGSPRQPESRRETIARADRFIDEYLSDGGDCLVIGHGFFFRVLSARMLRRGFHGRRVVYLRNGEHRTYVREERAAAAQRAASP